MNSIVDKNSSVPFNETAFSSTIIYIESVQTFNALK